MEKFVCLLVCLSVFVSTGFALECYTCDSEKIDGCLKDMKPEPKKCGPAAPTYQNVCAYTVLYDTKTKKDKVHSGCEQIPTTSPVNENSLTLCSQPGANMQKKECKVCNTDLCNSAPSFTSLVSLMCLPVLYFFTKYVLY